MADFSLFEVDVDTPQPNGRKGMSPRAAFTQYNDFLAQLGSMIETISATPPPEPVAYQAWIDISVSPALLRRRNAANTAWVEIGPALQSFGNAAFLDAIGSAPLYGRDSVVGTVGQSGGAPTGALFEYGSNSNGEFWKFAGGLCICRNLFAQTVAYAQPLLLQAEVTFPVGFSSSRPIVIPLAEISNSDPVRNKIGATTVVSVSGSGCYCRFNAISGQTFSSGDVAPFFYLAVGRWYN